MIDILEGQNQYLIDQFVTDLADKHQLKPQLLYADDKELNLIDRLLAQDLFSQQQLIVVKNLTKNKLAVDQIINYFELILADQSLFLVIVETKLDKRSKLYKLAKKHHLIKPMPLLKDYDQRSAVEFIIDQANRRHIKIDRAAAVKLWQLIGNDQLAQVRALEKLALLEAPIDISKVEQYISSTIKVDPFVVIDKLLAGDSDKVSQLIDQLEQVAIGPVFWAMVVSQIVNLAIVKANRKLSLTKDFALHPYVVQKLSRAANKLSNSQLQQILQIVDQTDYQLKTISGQEWLLIKLALVKISFYFKK